MAELLGHLDGIGCHAGAILDPRLNGSRGGWVPIDDTRLRIPSRSVRLGLEIGL